MSRLDPEWTALVPLQEDPHLSLCKWHPQELRQWCNLHSPACGPRGVLNCHSSNAQKHHPLLAPGTGTVSGQSGAGWVMARGCWARSPPQACCPVKHPSTKHGLQSPKCPTGRRPLAPSHCMQCVPMTLSPSWTVALSQHCWDMSRLLWNLGLYCQIPDPSDMLQNKQD